MVQKSTVGPTNSTKNKLNSKIILILHWYLNTWQKLFLSIYFTIQLIFATIHGPDCTF